MVLQVGITIKDKIPVEFEVVYTISCSCSYIGQTRNICTGLK